MAYQRSDLRTVKPRVKPTNANKSLIVVSRSDVYLERSGEVFPRAELPKVLLCEPSSIVVAHRAGDLVQECDDVFGARDDWQFRVTPIVYDVYNPNQIRSRQVVKESVVAFFGFSDASKKGNSRYFYPLDPLSFVRKTVFEIHRNSGTGADELTGLLDFGKQVRSFLVENDLQIRPTSGGIGGQLLRDRRFYPDARRKVPRATNDKVRDRLPGNFYRLYGAEVGRVYRASYLDQINAHHASAAQLRLPCANNLMARGRFATFEDKAWRKHGTAGYKIEIERPGLFYARIWSQGGSGRKPVLPLMEKRGSELRYFYSNELEELQSYGRIEYLIAAWTSGETDTGINAYAQWAVRQLARTTESDRGWIKPTLLSTYGILAAKAKYTEYGYKRAKGGEEKLYPIGTKRLAVMAKRTEKALESPVANVIHRGMIEAETRLESIRLARELGASGVEILAIYADSVFVRSGPLPLLPANWKIQSHLTGLRFLSATMFTSKELTKLPGVGGNEARKQLTSSKAPLNARAKQSC
jgi:hypothetical protein